MFKKIKSRLMFLKKIESDEMINIENEGKK
jgi:hypothetical protein